jgi:hypothetical protein
MPFTSFDSAQELVDNINLLDSKPDAYPHWLEVKHQAIRHTLAVPPGDLLELQRPNESENVREYRLANYRAITHEGAVKFNDKAARIINGSNWTLAVASEDLREWIEGAEFSIGNGEQVKFREYFCRLVMPCSFEDPNAVLLAFPFNIKNPDTPPANPINEGGLQSNEAVSIKTFIVPSDHIYYIDESVMAWYAGYKVEVKKGNTVKAAKVFFIVDRFNYYRYMPVRIDDQHKIVYELQLWYNHDTGEGDKHELPINVLGGTLVKDPHIDGVTYNESFMKSYFEYGDEVIVSFSDYQAVRVKSAYPIKVMTEQPCQQCHGEGRYKKDDEYQRCGSCNGTGTASGLSPFKDLIVEQSVGVESNRPPLEYVSPPVDVLKYMNEDWRNLLKDAKKSINLDLLESVVESGEAKKQRLQDLQDMLGKIAGNLFDVITRYLWHVECLIHPNRNDRVMPVISEPSSFDIKSEEILREEALNAPLADAFTAMMEYNRRKYRGDEKLIRVKELALMYAPLLAVKDIQELNTLLAIGAFTDADLKKRYFAEMIIKKVAREIDIADEANEQRVFERADVLMQPFLPAAPTPIIDADT